MQIERDKEDKEHILEIVSNKHEIAIVNNNIGVFGVSLNQKVFYMMLLAFLTFITLLFLSFIKYLERFKDKIQ